MESDRLQHLYLTGVRKNGVHIGTGSYGKVFEVEFCGEVYAAKEIHQLLIEGVRPEEFQFVKRLFIEECHRSSALGHRNVVRVLGVYVSGRESRLPILVMERMQESLKSMVGLYPNIPMCVKLSMLVDVSRGLWYLHSHDPPIIHRDLTPNNVLLTSQFVAKISDLGLAKVIPTGSRSTKTRAPGMVDFMGPEALAEIPEYGPPLDVFSYGGVILHVVNQQWPEPRHYVVTDPSTGRRVALSEVERRQEYVERMRGAPVDLRHLVEQCLDDDPSRRPPTSDVSERMRRMKEAENMRCPDVTMDPITWQVGQTTRTSNDTMLPRTASSQERDLDKEAKIKEKTEQAAKTMQDNRMANSQVDLDIFNKGVGVKWKEVAPLPVCRTAHTAVLLHGSVYVGGGFTERNGDDTKLDCYRLDVYNFNTNQWEPSPISTPFSLYAMTILNDKLITAGGHNKNEEVTNSILALDGKQWKNYSKLPTGRILAAAVVHQSLLITIGGKTKCNDGWENVATIELLDTTNGCWHSCDDLPAPHCQLKVAVMKNTLYCLGGYNEYGKPSSQVFTALLDNLSGHQLKWQSLPDTPCFCSTTVTLCDKFLLTVGGIRSYKVNEIYAFNPSSSLWKQIASLPAARSSAVTVAANNKLIVLGGITLLNEYSDTVWIGELE